MPDMGKRFSHHTNRENPLTQNMRVLVFAYTQKKNANNAFHNALFAHRTYIEMKKLSYVAEIHT